MKKLIQQKGFTLVELVVVIVIVGILAAVAIPKFTRASHKAKASEFPTVLTQIYTAEGAIEAETGSFVAADAATFTDNLGVTIPGSKFFSYAATQTDGTSFTATAGVVVKFGDAVVGNTATIDYAGLKTGSSLLLQYAPEWTNQ